MSDDSKASIQVIARMMHLIDALAASGDAASLKSLSAATGLHPSTAHRILGAMVEGGLADRAEPGSYRLGMRFLELGNIVRSRINVREVALPTMRELAQATGETVNLSVRQGDEIMYVERTAENRSMMRVVQMVGARVPLHVTAAGKLFLAGDSPEEVKSYAERSRLEARTPNSVRTFAELVRELDSVRQQGYALDREEAETGVRCVAAGVRDDSGALIAALSVSAPAERQKQAQWAPLLREASARISRSLGFHD
jgi:DNA-binding IclR family transcriptional regulator